MAGCLCRYAVRCRYNAVNFLPNHHKIHLIAHPIERGMGCILCAQTVVYTLHQSLQWCMQYHVILDCVITTLDCIWQKCCVAWGVLKNVLLFDTIVLGVISFACLDILVWSRNKLALLTLCTTPHNQDKAKYMYSVLVLFLANGDEYLGLTY